MNVCPSHTEVKSWASSPGLPVSTQGGLECPGPFPDQVHSAHPASCERRGFGFGAGQLLPSAVDFSPQVHCQPWIPSFFLSLFVNYLEKQIWELHSNVRGIGKPASSCVKRVLVNTCYGWWTGFWHHSTVASPTFFSVSLCHLLQWERGEATVVLASPGFNAVFAGVR